MKKRQNSIYLYLTLGVVLCVAVSFYFLTDSFGSQKEKSLKETTRIGKTTFRLLDKGQCSSRCTDVSPCDNYYLFSAKTTDLNTLYQFMKEFNNPNGCPTWILFQTDTYVSANWKEIISGRPDNVSYPKTGFALGFDWQNSFTLTDLENGKANGKYRKYDSNGKLFIEQEIENNSYEGKRIVYYQKYKVEQLYKNNTLISEDTIK